MAPFPGGGPDYTESARLRQLKKVLFTLLFIYIILFLIFVIFFFFCMKFIFFILHIFLTPKAKMTHLFIFVNINPFVQMASCKIGGGGGVQFRTPPPNSKCACRVYNENTRRVRGKLNCRTLM